MSLYNLLPSADGACKESLHSWWEKGFSEDQLTSIIIAGQSKLLKDASVGTEEGIVNPIIRRSKVAWFTYEDLPWLYESLGWIARQLNGQFFKCDVTGFYEDLQYTVYQAADEGMYDWHMDKGYIANGAPPRKLSLVVMLSDPNEYEGGDLEIMTGNGIIKLDKTKGMVHAFPSFLMHRVTPVTAGTRRSLVVWLCGPAWR